MLPEHTRQIARIASLCNERRRAAGRARRRHRIHRRRGSRSRRRGDVDGADEPHPGNRQLNLLARVQPNVITGDLQDAVEQLGLFYPPDPASLRQSALGGNVAECAGGPRAFKYGTTKRYVLALEAVLPTGEIVHTGSKAVKSVVGYDLTQLLVGSEGTLAIITEITLRLVPKPAAQRTLRASFPTIESAVDAVTALVRRRVVPAAVELVDRDSLEALRVQAGRSLAPEGAAAALILEVDGSEAAADEEIGLVEQACRDVGATDIERAQTDGERRDIWRSAARALVCAQADLPR